MLAYLVATRTNAETAATLFISEKTVSVHVSNLLRKTLPGHAAKSPRWHDASGGDPARRDGQRLPR